MPYIKPDRRTELDPQIEQLAKLVEQEGRAGELNYIITRLLMLTGKRKYKSFNESLGVLEAVKQELYRRSIAPYEDEKIEENGDVNEFE